MGNVFLSLGRNYQKLMKGGPKQQKVLEYVDLPNVRTKKQNKILLINKAKINIRLPCLESIELVSTSYILVDILSTRFLLKTKNKDSREWLIY